jgi:hypothetical protein
METDVQLIEAARNDPDAFGELYRRHEAHQVYVMNAHGSGKVNLSRNRSDDWATSWRDR